MVLKRKFIVVNISESQPFLVWNRQRVNHHDGEPKQVVNSEHIWRVQLLHNVNQPSVAVVGNLFLFVIVWSSSYFNDILCSHFYRILFIFIRINKTTNKSSRVRRKFAVMLEKAPSMLVIMNHSSQCI